MTQKKVQKVIMNVGDELHSRLRECAASKGITVASLVRMIVMEYFGKVGK